jgi:hypothetical protein
VGSVVCPGVLLLLVTLVAQRVAVGAFAALGGVEDAGGVGGRVALVGRVRLGRLVLVVVLSRGLARRRLPSYGSERLLLRAGDLCGVGTAAALEVQVLADRVVQLTHERGMLLAPVHVRAAGGSACE